MRGSGWQGLKVFENCGIDTELFKNGANIGGSLSD